MRQEQGRHFAGAFQKPVPRIYLVKKQEVEENVFLVSRNLLAVPGGAAVRWQNPRKAFRHPWNQLLVYFDSYPFESGFQTSGGGKKRSFSGGEVASRSSFY